MVYETVQPETSSKNPAWFEVLHYWNAKRIIEVITFIACVVSDSHETEIKLGTFDEGRLTQEIQHREKQPMQNREDEMQAALLWHAIFYTSKWEPPKKVNINSSYHNNLELYALLARVEGKRNFSLVDHSLLGRALLRTKAFRGRTLMTPDGVLGYQKQVEEQFLTGLPIGLSGVPPSVTGHLYPRDGTSLAKFCYKYEMAQNNTSISVPDRLLFLMWSCSNGRSSNATKDLQTWITGGISESFRLQVSDQSKPSLEIVHGLVGMFCCEYITSAYNRSKTRSSGLLGDFDALLRKRGVEHPISVLMRVLAPMCRVLETCKCQTASFFARFIRQVIPNSDLEREPDPTIGRYLELRVLPWDLESSSVSIHFVVFEKVNGLSKGKRAADDDTEGEGDGPHKRTRRRCTLGGTK
ncbi:hypothetical protein LZ32DRAFT_91353 [Colletotrichum eremochloae]|nr:hypothetical protein LZ32DRAFT_91353 [Colletotrichum eremochloae]